MKAIAAAIVVCSLCVAAAAQQSSDVSGEWVLTTDIMGTPLHQHLTLKAEQGKLAGAIHRTSNDLKIEGTTSQRGIEFSFRDTDNSTGAYTGELQGQELRGDAKFAGPDPGDNFTGHWSARRIPVERPSAARVLEFTPTKFERAFSSTVEPVLHIWPGDTVRTWTVDAGGVDSHSQARVLGGNPLTGPFYVETAMPGDVLAVTLRRLRLNRDYAVSSGAIVGRGVTPDYQQKIKGKTLNDSVRWKLDAQRGLATLDKPGEHLKSYSVPVRPMLGCIGVAPGFGRMPLIAGDSAGLGGNMDYNHIVEGATVYLPVAQPGALLYVGDGHALEGDGELTGNALETSLDVEFTVDVRHQQRIGGPRVEDAEFISAVGLGGSLDEAIRQATVEMANWLEQDYKLDPAEIAEVFGTAMQYDLVEVADRNVGIAARLRKSLLAPLRPASPVK